MPLTDTIQAATDSTLAQQNVLLTDSSLQALTDTMRTDSVFTQMAEGFKGLVKPSTPQNENWVFIALLLLLVLLVLSYQRSSGWLTESVKSFFRVKERSSIFSKTTVRDFESQFFLILFSTGVISLFLNLIFTNDSGDFPFLRFTKFLAVTSAFLVFKYILIQITGYVFTLSQKLKIARESYFKIFIFLSILLFPVLLIKIYATESLGYVTDVIALCLAFLASLVLIIKLFQIFFEIIIDSFYLLLYLCTLEILPFFLLYKVLVSIM